MTIQQPDDRHYFRVAKRMLDGKVVPFLGAGANLCGRPEGEGWRLGQFLPSGAELAQVLAKESGYPDADDRDLLRISQFVDAVLGGQTLYDYLRETFDAAYPPTVLHRFLARTSTRLRERGAPQQVVLTTNYDDALEQAFDEAGAPYDVLWYEAKPVEYGGLFVHRHGDTATPIHLPNEYDELAPDERTVIVKLHGAMVRGDASRDSYVITEDDYIQYLARNDIASQIPAVLRARITESHLLFLGYRMRDWNLRVVLQRLWGRQVLANKSWSIQREEADAELNEVEQKLWADRDVDLLYVPLDGYLDKLESEIDKQLHAAPLGQ
jgi:hypothetical protein